MRGMFRYSEFNGDISDWDVSNVSDFSFMFEGSGFNGEVSKWNMSKAVDLREMFCNTHFNGDLSKWKFPRIPMLDGMLLFSEFEGDLRPWGLSKNQIRAVFSNVNVDLSEKYKEKRRHIEEKEFLEENFNSVKSLRKRKVL